METILIGTLGAEPQVITLATALLLRQEPLERVVVVHTDDRFSPLTDALPALRAFFAQAHGMLPLECIAVNVVDTLTPADLDRFADILFAVLQTHLAAGRRIHLLLAGGRKSMALTGLSVAQLLLGPGDHVWHLHSDEALRHSGRFWPEAGDAVQLVELALAPPMAVSPRFTPAVAAASPAAARQALGEAE